MNNRNDLIAIEKLYHWLSLSKFRDLPPEAWVVRGVSLWVFFSFVIHHSKCLQKDCLETQIWTFTVRPLLENWIQTIFVAFKDSQDLTFPPGHTGLSAATRATHLLLQALALEHRLHLSSMKLADSSLASLSEWNFPCFAIPWSLAFILLHLRANCLQGTLPGLNLGLACSSRTPLVKSCVLLATVLWS